MHVTFTTLSIILAPASFVYESEPMLETIPTKLPLKRDVETTSTAVPSLPRRSVTVSPIVYDPRSESLYAAVLSSVYVVPATVALVGLAVEGEAAVYVPVTLLA